MLRRRLAHLAKERRADEADAGTGRGRSRRRRTRIPARARRSSPTARGCSSSTAVSRRSQAAARTLARVRRRDIPVCGIAKRLEEIWLPGRDFPVILPRNSEALFLFQRIRDEAHRFAITFQRQKRRGDIGSVLAEVPGLGPARVKELLEHFGSVARLKAGERRPRSPKSRGIGPALAAAIVLALRRAARPVGSSLHATEQNREMQRCRRGDAHRHGHVGRRALHRRQRPRGPRLVRRRQPPAADAPPARRSLRAHRRRHPEGRGRRRRPRRQALRRRAGRRRVAAHQRAACASSSSTPRMRCWCADSSRCAARIRSRATAPCSTASSRSATGCRGCVRMSDVVIDTSDLNIHQLATPSRSIRARPDARTPADAAEFRLQVRPPRRRRHRRRHAIPAEPVLGPRARRRNGAGRGGRGLRARAARGRRSSSTATRRRSSRCSPGTVGRTRDTLRSPWDARAASTAPSPSQRSSVVGSASFPA